MTAMLEKVARALHGAACKDTGLEFKTWEQTSEAVRETWRKPARAALEAMREPTEEMLEAQDQEIGLGLRSEYDGSGGYYAAYYPDDRAAPFRAAIDAALKDPPA